MYQKVDVLVERYNILLRSLLESSTFPFDTDLRSALPLCGGVYRIFERSSDVLQAVYVGKSGKLQNRIYRNHFMGNSRASTFRRKLIKSGVCADDLDIKQYLQGQCLVQFVVIDDANERTSFEHFAVSVLRPKYND